MKWDFQKTYQHKFDDILLHLQGVEDDFLFLSLF